MSKTLDEILDNAERFYAAYLQGEHVPPEKLTDNQVASILHMKGELTHKEIAKMYGVSSVAICLIHTGKIRRNISGLEVRSELRQVR